jgi:hypothetical protein
MDLITLRLTVCRSNYFSHHVAAFDGKLRAMEWAPNLGLNAASLTSLAMESMFTHRRLVNRENKLPARSSPDLGGSPWCLRNNAMTDQDIGSSTKVGEKTILKRVDGMTLALLYMGVIQVSVLFLVAPKSYAEVIRGVDFPLGARSFVDEVTGYNNQFGGPNPLLPRSTNRYMALGTPDGFNVSLGQGGRLTLRFTDNVLRGSNSSAPDLVIFEAAGDGNEGLTVEISKDGSSWISVGRAFSGATMIDIDAFGARSADEYQYVRLTDIRAQFAGAGADVDAVGAITSSPRTQVGFAPESLSGHVLNTMDTGGGDLTQLTTQSGLVYWVKDAGVPLETAYKFTYRKTAPNAGFLNVTVANGRRFKHLLFTSANGGTFTTTWSTDESSVRSGTFNLSEIPQPVLPELSPPLANMSTLTNLGSGQNLITGFVIGGDRPVRVLLRAVGAPLGLLFNVASAMANPALSVSDGNKTIASNDNWGGHPELVEIFRKVGAFALPPDSQDSVLLLTLSPGSYTASVSGGGGNVLLELFYVD